MHKSNNGLNKEEFSLLKEYFKDIYLWKPTGAVEPTKSIKCDLGCQMKKLYELVQEIINGNQIFESLNECLMQIKKIRHSDKSLIDWKKQCKKYISIVKVRKKYIDTFNQNKWFYKSKLDNVSSLNNDKESLWGSVRQIKFGKIVVDTLDCELDPVFGSLLSPTGGIVGPGNTELYRGNNTDSVVMHGIVHDAGGYLFNYHTIGPGYNYLGTKLTCFPSNKPMSNQVAGITFWTVNICIIGSDKKCLLVTNSNENSNEDSKL
jgi:hypothetical protein